MIRTRTSSQYIKRCSIALSSVWKNAAVAFLIGVASLLVYSRTLAPDIVEADGGEFQFAAWNFSLVHPTGYPLYLILGGLFQHLIPFGNPAFRLNLFTAITAASAVGMLFLVLRELELRYPAAIIASAAFAFSRIFWFDANAAEVYDLNIFFLALLMFFALRFEKRSAWQPLIFFAIALGLALTHHRSIALWIPAFALFFACSARSFRNVLSARRSLFLLFFFAIPLLLYLYVPLRMSATPYALISISPDKDISLFGNSPSWFVDYILGRTFQFEIAWDNVSAARLAAFPQLLLDQFGALGLLTGLVGFGVLLARRKWSLVSLILAGALITAVFASAYHIGDIEHYYLPVYFVWAIAIGFAAEWLLAMPRGNLQSSALALVIAVFLVVPVAWTNLPAADRSQENGRTRWDRILNVPIPQGAILLSNDRDEMMPFWYMQHVETRYRDVAALFPLITPSPEYADIGRLTDSVIDSGRPIYYIKAMPGLEVKYQLDASAPPLVRVLGRASDVPAQVKTNQTVAQVIAVTGYTVHKSNDAIQMSIYWAPEKRLDRDYTSFVHILDSGGSKVAQGNDHQVGGSLYPTSLWQVGQVLVDHQSISLPSGLKPGTYSLLAGMYSSRDSEPLGEPVVLGTLDLR